MLPNVCVIAAGFDQMRSTVKKLAMGEGFSNGCAEFALKNPPPLVPSCLMIRSEERRVGEEGRSRWAPHHYKKERDRRGDRPDEEHGEEAGDGRGVLERV